MLITAIIILTFVAMAGLWLGGLFIMFDAPPVKLTVSGRLHALGGIIGFAVLVFALLGTPPSKHALKMGVAGFGVFSGVLIGVALAIGLVILTRRVRRRAISLNIVAAHGLIAITGYTLLVTYLTMLR
jgi:hypothetical protein